jgi:hypothetical protein
VGNLGDCYAIRSAVGLKLNTAAGDVHEGCVRLHRLELRLHNNSTSAAQDKTRQDKTRQDKTRDLNAKSSRN